MSDSEEKENSEDNDVEIYHRINRLKIKAGGDPGGGPGYLDPDAINRAETVVIKSVELYEDEIKAVLENLSDSWKKLKNNNDDSEELDIFYNFANQVKDLAATFGYPLMQHFGLSLREFTEVIDLSRTQHHIIIQAHIDAMWAVYSGGIKDHGDKNAEDLKESVSRAIEKYS